MKLNEIAEGTEIKISIITSDDKLNVSTKIAALTDYEKKTLEKVVKQKDVYFTTMELIMQNNKSFGLVNNDSVTYNLSCTILEKHYVWNNVYIKTIKLPNGKICYLVLSPLDAPVLNRRDAYRLWIGEEVAVTLGLGQERIRAILKDVSASGMGVIVADAEQFHVERIVHALYIDSDSTNFNMTGKVVSVTEILPGKTLIGCKFMSRSQAIEKYVSQKQIERAKEKRGNKN